MGGGIFCKQIHFTLLKICCPFGKDIFSARKIVSETFEEWKISNASNLRQNLISSSEKCERKAHLKLEVMWYPLHTCRWAARWQRVYLHHLRISMFNNLLHERIQIQQNQTKFRTVVTLLVWGLVKDFN